MCSQHHGLTLVTQINIVTGATLEYPLPAGFYGQEPVFLQRPGTSGEDEGVLLVQGLDANQNKGPSLSHSLCVEQCAGKQCRWCTCHLS